MKIRIFVLSGAMLLFGIWVASQGCANPQQTAFQAESVGYITLQGAAVAYKAYKATHAVSSADDLKAHQLFAAAQQAEISAINLTETSTNGLATVPTSAELTALVNFLKSLGISL